MNDRCWWAAVLVLSGCSGNVDLGAADAPSKPLAEGAELVSFSRAPEGMCALFDDERAYCWGKEGSTVAHRAPELDAVQLAGAGSNGEICGIERDGSVACSNSINQKRSKKLGVSGAASVSVGFGGGCALAADGRFQCWEHPEPGYCAAAAKQNWLAVELPSPAVQVEYTEGHGCAVTADGRLYCFGMNHSGQSGQPTDTDRECVFEPTAVPDIEDAVQVALGMDHTCVLRSSGTVTCFGYPAGLGDGQTTPGDGQATSAARRADVPGLNEVVSLKASRIATCALESTGALKCWGNSLCGSLGIFEECGSTHVGTPLTVQGALEIQDFGMDDGLICALTSTQQIKCWGFSGWQSQALGSPVPRRIVF